MVRWPAPDRLSRVSADVVERFKKTAGAKELEQDSREWSLVTWPWMPEAPFAFVVRASDGEERQWTGDATGLWTAKLVRPANRATHAEVSS